MTVDPGWGGRAFLEHLIDKLRTVRALVGPGIAVEVDGDIDHETAPRPRCAPAGPTVLADDSPAARKDAVPALIDLLSA